MKVLVIRNSFIVAGAEIYYLKLQDAFNKFGVGYEIILVTNNQEFATKAQNHGIATYIVNTFGEEVGTKKGLVRLFINLPQYLVSYILIIRKAIKEWDIKAIIVSGKTEKYILTPVVWFMNLPTFWIEHGRVFTPTMSKIALFLYRLSSKFCTCILAESHDTEMDLIKNKINQKIIIYIGSGVDIDHFYFSKFKNIKRPVVGFMATINWEKGIKDIVETIKLTHQENKRIKFYILGDGSQFEYTKFQIHKNKLDSVVSLFGRITDVHRVLKKIDIILSPIKHPGGLSLSLLESMATGCIPIVSDMGGNRELVLHKKTGYIFSENYPRFASSTILELSKNPKLQKEMALNARKYILSNYSDEKFIKRIHNVLKNNISAY